MPSDGAPQTSGPAGRYAAALYAHASDMRALDEVVDQMVSLGRLIDASPEFRRLLASPLIDVIQARSAAFAVLDSEGFGKIVHDFVGVIISNRRIALLRPITESFAALVAEKRGVITATVTSAHELSDIQEQQLRARLIEAGYSNVNIVKIHRPEPARRPGGAHRRPPL